jgi:hypothetical protein
MAFDIHQQVFDRDGMFDLLPRKVSTSASSAEEIVQELQAFWTFLQREFSLANAAACLKVLDEKAKNRRKRNHKRKKVCRNAH